MKKSTLLGIPVVLTLAFAPLAGEAKGCLKGGAVGGVAGHVAGKHGVLGAAAGCAIGMHQASKRDKAAERAQMQATNSQSTAATPPATVTPAPKKHFWSRS